MGATNLVPAKVHSRRGQGRRPSPGRRPVVGPRQGGRRRHRAVLRPGDATVLPVDDTAPAAPDTIPGEVVFVRDLGTTFECFVDCGLDEPLVASGSGRDHPDVAQGDTVAVHSPPIAAWWWPRECRRGAGMRRAELVTRRRAKRRECAPELGPAGRSCGCRWPAGRLLPRAVRPDAGHQLLPAHRGRLLRARVRVDELVAAVLRRHRADAVLAPPLPAGGAAHDRGGVPVHVVPHPDARPGAGAPAVWCSGR